MTRVVARADELKALGAQPIRGDLRDADSLEFALRGVRVVVAAAHSMVGRGDESSEAVDDIGHRTLIDVAKQAGVEHIIYTSISGATTDHPIDFWRTKARIEEHVRQSGIGFTIVRPTALMDLHAYELTGKPVLEGKRVVLFGRGENPRNYVAAEDVAKVIAGALKIPSLRGQTIDVGGPENLTALQVIALFERISGHRAKVRHIPLTVMRVAARAMQPVHEGMSRLIRSGIMGETTDQTFDASVTRSRVPVSLTRLEDWALNRITA